MKIALFVEGPSDQETLSILARGVSARLGFVTRVLARGDMLNVIKVSAYIQDDIRKQHRDVRKILICVDSECTDEEKLFEIVRPLERQLRKLVRDPPVFYCGVIHATEAWLASDSSALGRYLHSVRMKVSDVRAVANACKPKQALAELFDRHGREFSNVRDNPRLALEADPQELIRRSKSFARFAKLLCDP
jgi:hypothetical protein